MKNEEGLARRPEGESQFATAKERPDWLTPGIHNMYATSREPTAEILYIGNALPRILRQRPQRHRVYLSNGIAPSLCARSGGQMEPKILIEYE